MTSLVSLSPKRNPFGARRPTPQPDCPQDSCTEDNPLVKRSASLNTLQPTIFEPRMAQLETLEAKMASIEVSLSQTPRRKKNGSLGGVSLGGSIRSIPKDVAVKELESLRNALRDKENIIQSLKGQLSIMALRLSQIRNGNICNNNNGNCFRELSEVEKKQAEDRLAKLRNETDAKRLAIKNLKMALERRDNTDNIDARIQQAELEYQLGREELNLLTLLEETRALQHCLEESNKKLSDSHTLFSCLSGNEPVSLHIAEIVYDPKSPRFGAGQRDSTPGLWVDWALEDTGLCKGDRLVEVNGKIVLTKGREDLARLLHAAPDPALLVVLRKGNNGGCAVTSSTSREVAALRCELEVVKERAEESQRAKDGLRSDNIRLTHRISYLEEQVSELLNRKSPDSDIRVVTQSPVITSTVKTSQNVTNINICSQPTQVVNKEQVFQKGPQMTTLVSNVPGLDVAKDSALPIRSKSSLSNVSNTLIAPSPQPSDHSCHKGHRHKHRSSRNMLLSSSTQNLDQNYKKHHHHHHHREKDYSSETNSEMYRARKSLDHPRLTEYPEANNLMDQSYRKATKIVQDLTKSKDNHLYEKHRSKCIGASEKYNSDMLRHYNSRKSTSVLDFRSEIHIGPKYNDSRSVEELDTIDNKNTSKRLYKKLHDARSVKSLDFDSDCNYPPNTPKSVDYTSEPIDNHKMNVKPRPTPPKKPLRLSLHRAQSLQSVETPPITPNGSPPGLDPRKPMKRNYKGEAPLNGHDKSTNMDPRPHQKEPPKWTSFAQKKDNLIFINDGRRSNWC
ncbi:PREDICTED: uncharacterized protein LOC108565225 [Nicrophorus vespilloides]|uniref:Uncharacterized protein LOC108565225 n=1 Tax=Nicrophorus vespilloides TaxID=110193 RepID=A0ABM1MZQ5_NICVS|nr:PREDICTED: uncharacterized protein LOC108565225 [Nicrophorus vespilloides]XP_017780056.1 PREDICTED: uncharacterized protein LOC108565225 [Nicrophorus vespilloides]XP_017780057.1 PREDICTED: uncharacterized protein LOC108565225 [Nicrophorus vespilloides]